jgi:hypothetical protein
VPCEAMPQCGRTLFDILTQIENNKMD